MCVFIDAFYIYVCNLCAQVSRSFFFQLSTSTEIVGQK